MTGIYKIENKKNHKCYIGQAIDINRRFKQHLRSFNSGIDKIIQAEGKENFDFSIIEECDISALDEREQYWIKHYNSYEKGYNQTRVGSGSSDTAQQIPLEKIKEIYKLLISSTLSQKEIAEMYNVGMDTISEINQGRTRIQPGYNFPLRNNKKEPKVKVKFSLSKEELIKDFIELKSFSAIGKKYGVTAHPVRDVAKLYGYNAEKLKKEFLVKKETRNSRPIVQMDLNGKILQEFPSTFAAGQQIHDEHIKQVCDGKRKTSKGFIYRYKDEL